MRLIDRIAFIVTLVFVITVSAGVSPAAIAKTTTGSAVPAPVSTLGPEVKAPVHYDVSAPLVDLEVANVQQRGDHRDIPRKTIPSARASEATTTGAPTGTAPSTTAPTQGTSFDGLGQGFGSYVVCCAPPDPNGAVGPNHYVQTVNLDFAIFNKSGGLVYGPAPLNTLWSGFGGGCQIDNDGDPTVIYDAMADRWLISQFAVHTTKYLNCVAVSTSSDPTGAYYRYSYLYTDFPDYPKFGVWPDAYYVSLNLFRGGSTFNGADACAYDRAKMLVGQAATQQCFQTSATYSSLLPSTLDGKRLPPSGEPNYFVALDTSTALASWKFHADFTTPANATFSGPTPIAVSPFTSSCSTLARGDCVPQGSGGTNLESLADRLMYRLAYRNFGDHAALVVNHTVEVGSGSTLHSGIRWYELRPNAGSLSVFQQGTYAPDANWRWVGSAAMDGSGNIGVGYSVSSPTISPQIHFTGRLAGDQAGTMTQGENVIINGGGSQTGGLARWGDYSSLVVDPVDDCTFWYTNEYLKSSGSFNWSTRIGRFTLPGCGAPDFAIAVTPASQTVVQGSSTSYTTTVTAVGGFSGTVTLSVSGLPAGANGTFNPPSIATSGSSTLTVTTASTTAVGSYPLTVTGTSGTLTHSATATLVVTAPPSPDFTIAASPATQTVIQGNGTSYTATVTATNGFTGTVDLSASGLPAGVTATFNPASVAATGTSTMSVTTASSTPPGSYLITITGTSGALTHSTSVTLVVNAPQDFTLSASPTTRTINVGRKTNYTITITPSGGFTGQVTLTVSGVPGGATASFNPNPAGTSSTLTVRTTSTTPRATSTLTITGTSGSLTHTTTVTLTVQ